MRVLKGNCKHILWLQGKEQKQKLRRSVLQEEHTNIKVRNYKAKRTCFWERGVYFTCLYVSGVYI